MCVCVCVCVSVRGQFIQTERQCVCSMAPSHRVYPPSQQKHTHTHTNTRARPSVLCQSHCFLGPSVKSREAESEEQQEAGAKQTERGEDMRRDLISVFFN